MIMFTSNNWPCLHVHNRLLQKESELVWKFTPMTYDQYIYPSCDRVTAISVQLNFFPCVNHLIYHLTSLLHSNVYLSLSHKNVSCIICVGRTNKSTCVRMVLAYEKVPMACDNGCIHTQRFIGVSTHKHIHILRAFLSG
jgi:hypothetical protein